MTVSFDAEDGVGGTGVDSTRYALDGGALQTYGGPFTVSAAGAHGLRFFSVDAAGNEEAEKQVSFTIAGQPRAAPTARLGKLRKRLPAARLARRGLRVSGRCAGVAGGTLKLIAPKRFARKLRLGRRATALASRRVRCLGGSFRVTLRPKPRARRALRRLRGRARLRLKVTMSGPAGRATAGATLVVRGR